MREITAFDATPRSRSCQRNALSGVSCPPLQEALFSQCATYRLSLGVRQSCTRQACR